MQGRLSAAGVPEEPHIGQHKQDTSAGALKQTVDGIRRLAQQRHGSGEGRGEPLQLYVPEDGLAGGAHQRVAEGLAVGVVQILDGPAPRFSLVQEAVLPIVQPLKIQPGANSAHKADTEEAREERRRRRRKGRLGQQGSTGDDQWGWGQREEEEEGGEGGYHINCHEAA